VPVVSAGRVSSVGLHSPETELRRGGSRGEGERPGGKAQVLEDGLGGGGAKDDGHDAAGAATARAGEDVRAERPLEELRPGDGAPRAAQPDGLGCQRARGRLGKRRGSRRWHDAGPRPGRWGRSAWTSSFRATRPCTLPRMACSRRPPSPPSWTACRAASSPGRGFASSLGSKTRFVLPWIDARSSELECLIPSPTHGVPYGLQTDC
jgi:hypothetical protein